MDGASFDGELDADSLQVGDKLLMRSSASNKASFKKVILSGAKVTGNAEMDRREFSMAIWTPTPFKSAAVCTCGPTTGTRPASRTVILRGAKVAGQVDMDGASFDGELDADSLQVGDKLLMRSSASNKASFKKVILRGAKVTGND